MGEDSETGSHGRELTVLLDACSRKTVAGMRTGAGTEVGALGRVATETISKEEWEDLSFPKRGLVS